jgi:hypothetical protein
MVAGARSDDAPIVKILHPESSMPASVALLGVLLVLVAIPLGLMFAPLVIGVIIVAVGLRRLGPDIAASAPLAA